MNCLEIKLGIDLTENFQNKGKFMKLSSWFRFLKIGSYIKEMAKVYAFGHPRIGDAQCGNSENLLLLLFS